MKNPSHTNSLLWSSGQRLAYLHLREIADLYFHTDFRRLTQGLVNPRLTPLVVAQSGSGKTHVIKMLAEDMQLAYLRLHPGNWIVNGVKDLMPTLLQVRRFVEKHENVILHLDELDKWRADVTTDWGFFGRLELFDLIDRCPAQSGKDPDWTSDALRRLRENVLIVGSATFQTVWNEALRPKLGFGKQNDAASIAADVTRRIEISGSIPDEVRLRFNRAIHVIPPPNADDFRDAATKMGIIKLAEQVGGMPLDFDLAVQSSSGARWLEETMGQLLLQAHQVRPRLLGRRDRKPKPPIDEPEEEFPDFGAGDEDEPVL